MIIWTDSFVFLWIVIMWWVLVLWMYDEGFPNLCFLSKSGCSLLSLSNCLLKGHKEFFSFFCLYYVISRFIYTPSICVFKLWVVGNFSCEVEIAVYVSANVGGSGGCLSETLYLGGYSQGNSILVFTCVGGRELYCEMRCFSNPKHKTTRIRGRASICHGG